MKVSSSAFLQGKKPALKELLNKLLSEYEYASILGQDSVAKNYTVSAGGHWRITGQRAYKARLHRARYGQKRLRRIFFQRY